MSNNDPYTYHIISNTHWDREWNHSFQQNRIALIDCLNEAMDLLENDPDYHHFHLDSQTIPLEDCMSVRPDMRPRIEKHIKDGSLLVGPWYTLPEMNLLDGESIVRNLLTGHRVGNEFGGVMKTGYNPMSNGQVSQLPQIYAGFGMDDILFYRGINIDAAPMEFWWEAPDGSKALAMQFPDGRGMFWSHGYLPMVYDVWGGIAETWPWKWGSEGSPFRIGDSKEYHNAEPTDRYRTENSEKALARAREWFVKHDPSSHLVLLEGHDQCPPYAHVPKMIADFNERFAPEKMVHDNLPNAMKAVKENLKDRPTLKGEMRWTNKSGIYGYCMIHPGILSARMYLKQANRQVENALFRSAEPAASLAWMLGTEYPKPFLDEALKMLLVNHAHDDICGCSMDKVHEDMMFRNSEIKYLTKELVSRSLQTVLNKTDLSFGGSEALYGVLYNTLPYERNEVAELLIDIPKAMDQGSVEFFDADGQQIPSQVEAAETVPCHISQDAITRGLPSQRYRVKVDASVPGLGYQALQAKPAAKPVKVDQLYNNGCLENEFISATINPNGTLDVTCKKTKRKFAGLHYFEDNGASGNAWVIIPPEKDKVINSLNCEARTKVISNGPVSASIEILITMALPVSLTDDFTARSAETKDCEIRTVVTLKKGSKRLELETSFDNQIYDHRLKVLFPSWVSTDKLFAEMPFDVVTRKIALPEDKDQWVDTPMAENPQVNFFGVQDQNGGLAITNRGLTDCAVIDDEARSLAMTLLRGYWQRGRGSSYRPPFPGFQCLGPQKFNYSIVPFTGTWEDAQLPLEGLLENVPMIMAQSGAHDGENPARSGFMSLSNPQLVVDTIKQSEDGKGIIVRLHNPSDVPQQGEINTSLSVKSAALINLEENKEQEISLNNGTVSLDVAPKKIVTVKLVP